MPNNDIISYYRDRAKEYEKIYEKPERQNDLFELTRILQEIFAGKEVFEIACGTGYWTEKIAKTAKKIIATDINETMLDIAKSKTYNAEIFFEKRDIFNLKEPKKFESVFGGFIWSHIYKQELDKFINIVNNLAEENGMIVFIDNNFVEGSNIPVSRRDKFGNTYQQRKLEDGSEYEVLKNFPDEDFLRNILKNKTSNLKYIKLEYYWLIKYLKQ